MLLLVPGCSAWMSSMKTTVPYVIPNAHPHRLLFGTCQDVQVCVTLLIELKSSIISACAQGVQRYPLMMTDSLRRASVKHGLPCFNFTATRDQCPVSFWKACAAGASRRQVVKVHFAIFFYAYVHIKKPSAILYCVHFSSFMPIIIISLMYLFVM